MASIIIPVGFIAGRIQQFSGSVIPEVCVIRELQFQALSAQISRKNNTHTPLKKSAVCKLGALQEARLRQVHFCSASLGGYPSSSSGAPFLGIPVRDPLLFESKLNKITDFYKSVFEIHSCAYDPCLHAVVGCMRRGSYSAKGRVSAF